MPKIIENPDGTSTVIFKEETLKSFDNTANLAEKIDEVQLKKLGEEAVARFRIDIGTRSGWEEQRSKWLKLLSMTRDAKSFPWEDPSNVALPTLTIAAVQFHARAFDAIYGERQIVKVKAKDGKSKDASLRVAKHMNYQLTEEMEEWEEDMDKLLMLLPTNGCAFKKTYYDAGLERNVSRYIPPEDFVVNYNVRSLGDADQITHILRMSPNKVRKMGSAWRGSEEIKEPTPYGEDGTTGEMQTARDLINKLGEDASDKNRPRIIIEQHVDLSIDGNPIAKPYIITVDLETAKVFRLEKRVVTDPVDGKEREINFFTDFQFLPNPESIYGFGFGHLLGSINESINTVVNQLLDAGTLANISGASGLFNKGSGMKTGDLKFKLGEFKGVNAKGDDLKKNVMTFDFNPPSIVLFNLLDLLQNYATNLSTVTDSMLGKLPPSDTTATTMLAVLEQGLKVFSTIQRRIHRSLRKEFKKIFILNSIHTNEGVYAEAQDSTSEEFKSYVISKADYVSTLDVLPVSDPNITSKAERVIKVREAWNFMKENPIMSQDQEAVYLLSKEMLAALEVDNIDKLVKMPEPEEPPDLTPEEEHAGFIREVEAVSLPHQDHASHLEAHQTFGESLFGEELTPQGKQLLQAHIRDTTANLYLSQNPPEKGGENGIQSGGVAGVVGGTNDGGDGTAVGGASGEAEIGNLAGGLFGEFEGRTG